MKFSANLGFLWADRPLPDAIRAAAAAGFDAVELHWPYATPPAEVTRALRDTGLPCLGLNTRRGQTERGENGLAALPGREAEARAAIDEGLAYGAEIGAGNLHVMAGVAQGAEARASFLENLAYACDRAEGLGMTILIEPLNRHDAPGYFLATTAGALGVMDELSHPALKLMFDCYHVQISEGDLSRKLHHMLPRIGHIQFASVPDRGQPDRGEVDYRHIFALLDRLGYDRPLGAEYKSGPDTGATLDWMQTLR